MNELIHRWHASILIDIYIEDDSQKLKAVAPRVRSSVNRAYPFRPSCSTCCLVMWCESVERDDGKRKSSTPFIFPLLFFFSQPRNRIKQFPARARVLRVVSCVAFIHSLKTVTTTGMNGAFGVGPAPCVCAADSFIKRGCRHCVAAAA